MSDEQSEATRQAPSATKKRRIGKRGLRLAWGAGVLGFALPWAAIQAMPDRTTAAASQLVVVLAGSNVVVPPGSRVITSSPSEGTANRVATSKGSGTSTTPQVTKTGGSAPPTGI